MISCMSIKRLLHDGLSKPLHNVRVIQSVKEMQQVRRELGGEVSFVPTMGSLHEGHMSLLEIAKKQSRYSVVSIFVNDTQFAPHEDFSSYPRNLEKDLFLLSRLSPDIVFAPSSKEMYPDGFCTRVDIDRLGKGILDGISRPHFFGGVCTVVSKLFNIVQPQYAIFGQKDAQQCAVIQQMVKDMNFPIEIIVAPTSREEDGLARSSRNQYLKIEERKVAGLLYKGLSAAEALAKNGVVDAKKLQEAVVDVIKTSPMFKIDYVSVVNPLTLEAVHGNIPSQGALILLACYLGKARLIDNLLINNPLTYSTATASATVNKKGIKNVELPQQAIQASAASKFRSMKAVEEVLKENEKFNLDLAKLGDDQLSISEIADRFAREQRNEKDHLPPLELINLMKKK